MRCFHQQSQNSCDTAERGISPALWKVCLLSPSKRQEKKLYKPLKWSLNYTLPFFPFITDRHSLLELILFYKGIRKAKPKVNSKFPKITYPKSFEMHCKTRLKQILNCGKPEIPCDKFFSFIYSFQKNVYKITNKNVFLKTVSTWKIRTFPSSSTGLNSAVSACLY